jgi:hypothetical protein
MKRCAFACQAAGKAVFAECESFHAMTPTPSCVIPRRTLGRTGEKLSIIGFGGIIVMNEETGAASNLVSEAVAAVSTTSTLSRSSAESNVSRVLVSLGTMVLPRKVSRFNALTLLFEM